MDTINVRLNKQEMPIEVIKDSKESIIRTFPKLEEILYYVNENQDHNLSDVLGEMENIEVNDIRDLLTSKNGNLNNLGINILSEFLNLYEDYIDDDVIELPLNVSRCIDVYTFILLDKSNS